MPTIRVSAEVYKRLVALVDELDLTSTKAIEYLLGLFHEGDSELIDETISFMQALRKTDAIIEYNERHFDCLRRMLMAARILESRYKDLDHELIPEENDARALLKAGIQAAGADGLANPECGCGCGINDNVPCCCVNLDGCVAAKKYRARSDKYPDGVYLSLDGPGCLWERYQQTGTWEDLARWLKHKAFNEYFGGCP